MNKSKNKEVSVFSTLYLHIIQIMSTKKRKLGKRDTGSRNFPREKSYALSRPVNYLV